MQAVLVTFKLNKFVHAKMHAQTLLQGKLMQIIRWILGRLILLINFLTPPRGVKRSAAAQAEVDAQTQHLVLYQYHACPFCVKVRRAFKRHSLNIETRDAKRSEQYKQELVAGGGALKVPCLRIENHGTTEWLYESSAIIAYVESRFGEAANNSAAQATT